MALGDGLLVPMLIFGGIGLFLVGAGLREAYLTARLWRNRPIPIGELGQASGRVTVTGTAVRIDKSLAWSPSDRVEPDAASDALLTPPAHVARGTNDGDNRYSLTSPYYVEWKRPTYVTRSTGPSSA